MKISWEQIKQESLTHLRELVKLDTSNPPGNERIAIDYYAGVLGRHGIDFTIRESAPTRANLVARMKGRDSAKAALMMSSHVDVVPVEAAQWTRPPFSADIANGCVWGRGSIDMKPKCAMDLAVMTSLKRAGIQPEGDLVLAAVADEEAGSEMGAKWLVERYPDLIRADYVLNEIGGFTVHLGDTRIYPIQVAEKGFVVYRLHVKGRWGHGSVPTPDNAAVLAARISTRLAEPGRPRLTQAMNVSVGRAIPHLAGRAAGAASIGAKLAARFRPGTVEIALRRIADPVLGRTISAMIRDTISVGIVQAGLKYNVIPGTAEIEIDCRTLPGTDEPAMRAELRRRIGEELWSRIEVECEQVGAPVQSPMDGPLYPLLEQVVRDHDPRGVPLPFLAPFATDAKHLARIGVPVYGFSPLKLQPGEGLFDLMHATDERVSVAALRFGLPVLYDAVYRFCSGTVA